MRNDKIKYIYALTDNDRIFYIGQSYNVQKRLKAHIVDSLKLHDEKDKLIQDILFRSRKLDAIILDKCKDINALKLESEIIKNHILSGCNLVNNNHAPKKQFTMREIKIMQFMGNDFTTKQIAKKMFMSTRTLETNRNKIKSKAGVNSMGALVCYAYRNKLIK